MLKQASWTMTCAPEVDQTDPPSRCSNKMLKAKAFRCSNRYLTIVVKAGVSCNGKHVLKNVSPNFSSLLSVIPLNVPYTKPLLLCFFCLAFLVFFHFLME